jgi:hypothetical protein
MGWDGMGAGDADVWRGQRVGTARYRARFSAAMLPGRMSDCTTDNALLECPLIAMAHDVALYYSQRSNLTSACRHRGLASLQTDQRLRYTTRQHDRARSGVQHRIDGWGVVDMTTQAKLGQHCSYGLLQYIVTTSSPNPALHGHPHS